MSNGDEIEGASIQKGDLPAWTDWHTHRIDWLPGITRFYLDGQLVTENKVHVPTKPMFIDVNMWSDGGVWSGAMDVGNSAELHIQWIQAVFNTSGSATGSSSTKRSSHLRNRRKVDLFHDGTVAKRADKCKTVCVVDNTTQAGVPEVGFQSQVSKNGLSISTLLFCVGVFAVMFLFGV